MREALHALPRIQDGTFLSMNCSHHAAIAPEVVDLLEGVEGRVVLEITEHEAIEDYRALAEALAPSASEASVWPSTTWAPATRASATRSSWRRTW